MAAMDLSWSSRGEPKNDRRRIREELTHRNPRTPSKLHLSRCPLKPRGPGPTVSRAEYRSFPDRPCRSASVGVVVGRTPLNWSWLRHRTGFPRGPDRRRWSQTPSFVIWGGLCRNVSLFSLKNRTGIPSGTRPRKYDTRIVPPECVNDTGEGPS